MSSFAPYTPSQDDPPRPRIWFSHNLAALPSSTDMERGQHNIWETTYGLRVDVLSAYTYILGPISALTLLVLETHNDYVRFHAYQAALLMTPLLTTRILAAVLQIPSWICSFLTFCASGFSMAAQAFLGASGGGLSRYHLPKLGPLADQWVDEE